MSKSSWGCISLCLAAVLHHPKVVEAESGEVEPQAIISRWFDAVNELRSYDCVVEFSTEVNYEKRNFTTRRSECRCRYQLGMWRIDYLHDSRVTHDGTDVTGIESGKAYAFDGEKTRFLNPGSNFGQEMSSNDLERQRLPGPMPFELMIADFRGPLWSEMLVPRLKEATITYLGESSFSIVFPPYRGRDVLDHSNIAIDLDFDRTKSRYPTSITLGKSYTFRQYDLQFDSDDRFVSAYSYRLFAGPHTKDEEAANIFRANVKSVVLNEEIPLEVFSLEFPPGTIVADHQAGRNYIATETGEKDYQAYAKVIRERVEQQRAKHQDNVKASKSSRFLWVFSFSSFAIAVLFCIAFLWKIRS